MDVDDWLRTRRRMETLIDAMLGGGAPAIMANRLADPSHMFLRARIECYVGVRVFGVNNLDAWLRHQHRTHADARSLLDGVLSDLAGDATGQHTIANVLRALPNAHWGPARLRFALRALTPHMLLRRWSDGLTMTVSAWAALPSSHSDNRMVVVERSGNGPVGIHIDGHGAVLLEHRAARPPVLSPVQSRLLHRVVEAGERGARVPEGSARRLRDRFGLIEPTGANNIHRATPAGRHHLGIA